MYQCSLFLYFFGYLIPPLPPGCGISLCSTCEYVGDVQTCVLCDPDTAYLKDGGCIRMGIGGVLFEERFGMGKGPLFTPPPRGFFFNKNKGEHTIHLFNMLQLHYFLCFSD